MRLSDQETATVLAALRHWQSDLRFTNTHVRRHREHFAEHEPLSIPEIDHLCQKINFGESEG